jgi:hypothetical protein
LGLDEDVLNLAVFYPYVLEMTAEERQEYRDEPEQPQIDLPPDALIIAGRLGEPFEFIRCNNPDDSPVWYYNIWDLEVKPVHDTALDWLYVFADEAQEAIAGGYYDMFPDGTRP